jgi:hypothetical protein
MNLAQEVLCEVLSATGWLIQHGTNQGLSNKSCALSLQINQPISLPAMTEALLSTNHAKVHPSLVCTGICMPEQRT